ncbi:TPA: NADH-quinone oxidoreductase subunit M [Candidatus Bathyarchaeota archaeon]|nr:NADH-quinone oxidoreductase subunit M [Candidatus Bathyarchaeota archaeon]
MFITSNLMVFYFCWEFMLVPAYFIIGGWGHKNSYRAAFKFFVFTHAGAASILLGIGATYLLTGTLDMFKARDLLSTSPKDELYWIFIAYLIGFLVKMAIVPFHTWLPDTYAEAPIPMAAIMSGVITEAGAYGILRIPFSMILPSISNLSAISHILFFISALGVISALYGAAIAIVENDMRRILAYSSISQMGYVLFGLSLYPFFEGLIGAIFHLVTHGISKGLLFLCIGSIIRQTNTADIRQTGGLAKNLPFTAISTAISVFSIAGIPPLACFMSEFLIFAGGFTASSLKISYYITTNIMLIATLFSLAYALRIFCRIFLGVQRVNCLGEAPLTMILSMLFLAIMVIVMGIWPDPVIKLISHNVL